MPKVKKGGFTDMVKKTMTELVRDLSTIDGSLASTLDHVVRPMKAREITMALQDTSSELYRNIPVDTLRKSPQGKQYLELLAVIQPAIGERIKAGEEMDRQVAAQVPKEHTKTVVEVVDEKGSEKTTTTVETTSIGESSQMPVNPFAGLFAQNDDNKMLMDLANEISSAVNYEPSSGIPDPADLLTLMTRVSDNVQERINNGQLDVNALELQARNLMERMQSVPEVANMMQNPQFLEMLGGMTQ